MTYLLLKILKISQWPESLIDLYIDNIHYSRRFVNDNDKNGILPHCMINTLVHKSNPFIFMKDFTYLQDKYKATGVLLVVKQALGIKLL